MKLIATYLTTLLLILPFCGQCAHIIGGTVTYTSLGIDEGIAKLEVYLSLYRDGNTETPFDELIEVAVYGFSDGNYEYITSRNVSLISTAPINYENSGTCTYGIINQEEGLYAYSAEVPVGDYEYYTFAYQRCCRGNGLTNILSPSETGIAISMDIYLASLQTVNQVFSFVNGFPSHVEPGNTTEFEVSAPGPYAEKYYLTTPKAAGGILGSTVAGDPFSCDGITPDASICIPAFEDVSYVDPLHPYGEGAVLELDEDSGLFSVTIPTTSQTLVEMTVEHYQDGQLFSKLRQQFVINSFSCPTSVSSASKTREFAIWPSPAETEISFNLALKNITLFNSSGRSQWFDKKNAPTVHIHIGHLEKGIYFIKGQTDDGHWIVRKFLKI